MTKVFEMQKLLSDVVKGEWDYQYTREAMHVTADASDVEVKVGELYVKGTATKLTETKSATPAAWKCKLKGSWATALPEVYTIKIGGTWAADDTLVIGSTTYTAKAEPTVASNQFSAGGTPEVIVQDIKASGLTVTNFTVTYDGDTIVLTQSVPGTGSAPAATPTSSAGTATLANTQNYSAGTITIGSTTVTLVDGTPSSNQVKVGTPSELVARLVALALTYDGYAITGDGDSLVFTQATASSTQNAPTVTCDSAGGSVEITKSQDYAAAVSGNTDTVDCICLENRIIPAGESRDVLVLANGPAIIDIDQLEGVTDKAAMKARLAALRIKTTDDPPVTAFQQT